VSAEQNEERFLVEQDFAPAYRAMSAAELSRRVEAARTELANCHACPRNCGVDRLAGETKVCKTGRHARVSSAFAHRGEEDPLRGSRGSGTIFFALCNLTCVFCQNWDLSQKPSGRELSAEQIATLMLELQTTGCHNVNFVTPEHVAPQVIESIALAIDMGLRIPIVYNTSAYDSLSTLRLLDGLVDIYMPDFKIWDSQDARRLVNAKDYPERAREAIREMHRQVGPLKLDRHGVARRGLLVRHLVMPGQSEQTAAIVGWLAEELSPDTYLNLMGQYRPSFEVGSPDEKGEPQHLDIARRPSGEEMELAYTAARAAGLWRFDERRVRSLFG